MRNYVSAARAKARQHSEPGAQAQEPRTIAWLGPLVVLALAAEVVWATYYLSLVIGGQAVGDWNSFYAAAAMVHSGAAGSLFDVGAQQATQSALYQTAGEHIGYPLPAFVAFTLSPLAALSYRASYFVMLALNSVLLAIMGAIAWRLLRGADKGVRSAAVLVSVTSIAAVNVLLFSQFDLLALIAVLGCWLLLRSERPVAAGVVLAAGLCKPQLVAGVVLLLVVTGQWRALAATTGVGAALLAVPAIFAGPGLLRDQMAIVASYNRSSSAQGVHAELMVNVRGLVVSLTHSDSMLLWAAPLAVVAMAALIAAVTVWRRNGGLHAQSWALALLLPLVCSPHVHAHSLVLLIGAVLLFVRDDVSSVRPRVTPAMLWMLGVGMMALWIASIDGVALTCLLVLSLFVAMVRAWPAEAAVASGAPPVDDLGLAA